LETNALRCKGIWIPKIVSVKPLPNTIASASNDYNVCPESGVKGYKVFGLPGSVFEWILSGQFELPRGQGTDSIYTIWGGSNPRLKVLETSAFGCISDTLKFNLNYDNSQPEIISVSTLEADDSKIEIKFGLKSPQNHPTKTFELWKDGSLLSSFNALETRFIDIGVQTQEKIYTYETQTKNSCGTVLKSGLFNNMVLRSLALENEGKSDLTWNRYNPNVEAPVQYNVLRKVDNVVLDGTFGTLNFLQSETPAELKSSIFETYNGFKQCYRTTFSKNGIIESYSNWSCVDFENRLVFPNLITPNGDGKNDVFEIRNISLFPDATLSIFNRWGEEVYSTANYQNDWKDKDGVYFYKFKSGTIDNNGWITVVK